MASLHSLELSQLLLALFPAVVLESVKICLIDFLLIVFIIGYYNGFVYFESHIVENEFKTWQLFINKVLKLKTPPRFSRIK